MAEKRYYWLRLYDDFFGSKRIKILRRMAGGDTYTIIYLKMQLLAMKTDGVLKFNGLLADFAEELAVDIDEEAQNVKVTLAYLLSCGLAETDDNVSFFFPYAVANTGSETASTQRWREWKNRKALESNTTPTLPQQNANVEIEKEIERDTRDRDRVNYQEVVKLYNETCVSLPAVHSLSDARKKSIKARLSTYSVDDFSTLFKKAEASSFLKGKNNRNWQANFDWLIKDGNMAKVLDGNYDDKRGNNSVITAVTKDDVSKQSEFYGFDDEELQKRMDETLAKIRGQK